LHFASLGDLRGVVTTVADNHCVWSSVGSKAGLKVGDVVSLDRMSGDEGSRAMFVGNIKLRIVEETKAYGEDTNKPEDGHAPRFVTTDKLLMPNPNPPVKP